MGMEVEAIVEVELLVILEWLQKHVDGRIETQQNLFLGGGHCRPEDLVYCDKLPESFLGGENGEDGHGFVGQHTAPGQGTYQDISKYYLQYFKISPGAGGVPCSAVKDGGLV